MDRDTFNRMWSQLDDMPSATKAAKRFENGEKLERFTCEYEHEGVMSTFIIYAKDMYDAAKRLGSMVENATVKGHAPE